MTDPFIINGAWYVEALPNGQYAAAVPGTQKVITRHGEQATGRDLLFIRCGMRGGEFHFAGQAINGDGNFEDVTRVGDSFGVNPLIYLQDGTLKQVPVGESHQGYRFVRDDGHVMTGDETLPLEWTEFEGVRIRQGQEGGCLIEIEGTTRVLNDGDAFFIRVQHEGENFAIAFWQKAPIRALIYWISKAEMRTLPLFVAPAPQPTPVPEVPPVSNPVIPPPEIERAKAEIAAHPLGANQPDLPWTNARAYALGGGWGLNGKRGDASNLSHDILAYKVFDDDRQPILVDVLGDGGGANTEQFDVLPYPQEAGAVWVAPTKPQDAPGPTPVTPPAPTPPFDPAPLLERLGGLESALAALTSTVEVLRSAIALPEPSREVVVTGRTDRAGFGPLSHSHSFSTKVVI